MDKETKGKPNCKNKAMLAVSGRISFSRYDFTRPCQKTPQRAADQYIIPSKTAISG